MNNKFVNNLDLTTDATDNLTLFGLYKTKESGHVTGYFITSIDRKTNAVSLKKMEDFPQALLELVDEDDQGLKKEKDPGLQVYFGLKDVLQRDNGSLDYVLEYYRKVEHTSTSQRGSFTSTRTYYTYEYGDIIDINVAPNGKTTFVRVPKMQFTTDWWSASSFAALTVKNKLYLFYHDDKDNIVRALTKKPTKCNRF